MHDARSGIPMNGKFSMIINDETCNLVQYSTFDEGCTAKCVKAFVAMLKDITGSNIFSLLA